MSLSNSLAGIVGAVIFLLKFPSEVVSSVSPLINLILSLAKYLPLISYSVHLTTLLVSS